MTLLTPPSSSHRLDKENFKFTVAAPLPGRVVWSSQNSYHSLTTPPKPCVASKERPVKSILKRRQETTTLLAVPDDNTKEREVTPEPADPLVNLNYLNHPVSIILKGADASLRDLIEGYSVLAVRLRTSVTDSTDADASWPLFQPLRKNREAFVDAVVRDLGRALIDPASVMPCTEEVMDKWLEDEEQPPKFNLPSPQSSPVKKRGMSAEQAKHARDLATTCLSVIRLLSLVLTTPAIYSVFETKDLRTMLTSILAIPLAEELPTPNARKTRALAIWLLQVQRLPSDVLHPAGDRIAYALRRGMDGELGKEGKKGSANDGLKAVHDLSIFLPATFVPSFTEILPSILSNLLAPTLALRIQACHALGGFVLGTISIPQSHQHTRIANIIADHLTTIPVTPTKKSPSKLAEAPIVRTLRTTMAAVDPTNVAQGPVWAISVLSCFVVLLGSKLYTNQKLGRLVCSLLTLASSHKKSTVRGLLCVAWRVVTWAYAAPPLPVEMGEESEVEEGNEVVKPETLSKESVWRILVTVVDCQAGVATIAALMADESEEGLQRTFQVLVAMINKAGKTCGDAVAILQHLLCFESRPREWNINHLIPESLFSSNPGLLTADFKNLSTAVQPLLQQVPTIDDIRSLTREEVAMTWVFDGLISVWWAAMGFLEMDDEGLPHELAYIWKSLLKTTVDVLQESEDTEGIAAFGRRAAGILTEILRNPGLDFTLKPAPPGVEKPMSPFGSGTPSRDNVKPGKCTNGEHKSRTVQKLWRTMRILFPAAQLGDAGEHLLKSLMDNERELVDPLSEGSARAAWASLCTDVLSVCDVASLRDFWGCEEGGRKWDWTNEDKETIWKTCVEKWKKVRGHWEGGVVLLGVPFTDANQWGFRTEDDAQWGELLEQVIGKAFDYGLDSQTVLNDITAFISAHQAPTSGVSSTRAAELLISHLDIVEAREIPEVLVEFVNDTMRSTYPPEPRNKPLSLWLVRNITQMITDCPLELCLQMLGILQEGLCLWLSDEYECWSMDELDYNIIPLYQFLLNKIGGLPQDIATLEVLAPILDSVFSGRTMPPGAAEAFNEYWQFTYANMPVPEAGWPQKILHCLGLEEDASKRAPSDSERSPTPSPVAPILPPSTPLLSSFGPQSPRRPHKPLTTSFETFPLPMRSPESPVRRRTASSSSYHPTTPKRTPLCSISNQSGGSPAKRRRIGNADEEESANKENASPYSQLSATPITVAEKIAASGLSLKPISSKKRLFADEEVACSDSDASIARPSPTKKLKLRERMCAKNVTPKSKGVPANLASPPSTCSSKDSEDERYVENALLPLPSLLAFPMQAANDQDTSEEYSCPPTPTPVTRKRVFMEAVVVPTLQQVQRKRKLEHSQSFESLMTASTSDRLSFPTRKTPRIMKRSVSDIIPAALRKRRRSSDSDPFLVISSTSAPLPALRVTQSVRPMRTYSMRSQKMASSDDDPQIGQVTPNYLISSTMVRKLEHGPTMEDVFAPEMPGSEDSIASLESPTKDVAARRQRVGASLTKVPQW